MKTAEAIGLWRIFAKMTKEYSPRQQGIRNCPAAPQMLGRGLRSVLVHMSRPMTAKRAWRDCDADVVLPDSPSDFEFF